MKDKTKNKSEMLLAELRVVNSELNSARADFSRSADNDMTEAAIYALNGLNSRYGFIIRQIKALTQDMHNSPPATIRQTGSIRRVKTQNKLYADNN